MGKRAHKWTAAAVVLVFAATAAAWWAWERRPVRGPDAAAMPYVSAQRSDEEVLRGATRIYHARGCRHAAKISPERLIGWRSPSAARSNGYRPCRVCIDSSAP